MLKPRNFEFLFAVSMVSSWALLCLAGTSVDEADPFEKVIQTMSVSEAKIDGEGKEAQTTNDALLSRVGIVPRMSTLKSRQDENQEGLDQAIAICEMELLEGSTLRRGMLCRPSLP